jgi:hypothetical protein
VKDVSFPGCSAAMCSPAAVLVLNIFYSDYNFWRLSTKIKKVRKAKDNVAS